jgi:hypothetical protein
MEMTYEAMAFAFLGVEISYDTMVYPKISGLAAWSENCK